jgi:hypothetical protein
LLGPDQEQQGDERADRIDLAVGLDEIVAKPVIGGD